MTEDAPEGADEAQDRFGLSDDDRAALRAAFHDIGLHKLLQIEHEVLTEERVVTAMPVAKPAFNPSGNLHGGSIATLIDVACGTAAALGSPNFQPGVNTLVTADMHIRYLGRAKGSVIKAEAQVMRTGRQLTIVECQVHDPEHDKIIAFADFAAMIVPLREPLQLDVGDRTQPDI